MSDGKVELEIKELNLDMIRPSTEQMHDLDTGGSKIVVIGKPGCFQAGTPILMFGGGIKAVEDVEEGEEVMGDDSTPRTVLEVCRNRETMYRVVMDDLESYVVNEGHKLVLIDEDLSETIEVTVRDYIKWRESEKSRWRVFRRGVQFPERPTRHDPYEVGLYLGDIENVLPHVEGLGSDNFEKMYIEPEYKINSRHVRMQVLAGIIDANPSHVINTVNKYLLVKHDSERMIDDIVFLCRSLGLIAKAIDNKTKVYIMGNLREIPTKYRSLAVDEVSQEVGYLKGYDSARGIHALSFQVQRLEEDNYYGFTIDGNHRFMLGSFDVVRNTGKTTLIASILYAKKHIYPCGMFMSGSEDSNGFYQRIIPSTFVYNEYNPEKVKDFIRRQKIARQHLPNPWGVLLLDDCTDDPKTMKTPLMQGIFKRGRHNNMLFILSLQYCMDIPPAIRTNTDSCFICREPILKNRKKLWENFASIIPDFNLFCTIMDQITDDYTALYIHNQTRSNNWRDCVFWYKAKIVPKDFKFGSKDYWDFHNARFNTEYKDPL